MKRVFQSIRLMLLCLAMALISLTVEDLVRGAERDIGLALVQLLLLALVAGQALMLGVAEKLYQRRMNITQAMWQRIKAEYQQARLLASIIEVALISFAANGIVISLAICSDSLCRTFIHVPNTLLQATDSFRAFAFTLDNVLFTPLAGIIVLTGILLVCLKGPFVRKLASRWHAGTYSADPHTVLQSLDKLTTLELYRRDYKKAADHSQRLLDFTSRL